MTHLRDRVPDLLKRPVRAVRHQYRMLTASGRVLPSVILAGVQKGGTTSLYHQLRAHPKVLWVPSKGTHYFDLHYSRGPTWYRSRCPHQRSVQRNEARSSGKALVAESCGYYFDHPLAPVHCAETLPGCRVIIMLRNPVERTYSHYHDITRKGLESLPFEEAIDRESSRLAGEIDKIVSDPNYYSSAHRHHSYLARSTYIDHVQRWFEAMGRENVVVLNSEHYYRDMAREYARVLEFLNLPEWRPAEFEKRNVGGYSKISQGTRAKLEDYFGPHNKRLYDYLGVDFGWD